MTVIVTTIHQTIINTTTTIIILLLIHSISACLYTTVFYLQHPGQPSVFLLTEQGKGWE
jgi:hypothetical protein